MAEGSVAVVTGAAGGIGLAAAHRFASLGMRVCIADIDTVGLARVKAQLANVARGGEADVLTVTTNVADIAAVRALRDAAHEAFGDVSLLMNNAAIARGGGPYTHYDQWRKLMDVNFGGVLNGVQVFAPDMIGRATPSLIINVGSKQGITNPPGNAAYSVSKAAVKTLTEQLAHELRQNDRSNVTAHLLIPGWTFTNLTSPTPAANGAKPDGAWTADQVVDAMMAGIAAGDFYILCPDNETTPEMDRRRIQWAMGDLVENRPAMSRWDARFKSAFAAFMKSK